jgi:signal transduction histidine kinase
MENQSQLVIFIIISFIAIISPAMAVIAIMSKHRRKILEKEARIQQIQHEKEIENYRMVVEASEKEREKIAKNLHDGIIPTLSVIKSSLDMNVVDYDKGKYDAERMKRDVMNLEQIIVEIRGVSHDLVPPSLAMNGVVKALEDYVTYSSQTNTSKINFENRTTLEETMPLKMSEQHNVYRICLELLYNLQKHSFYKTLHVILENDGSSLRVEFIHDGKGVNNEEIERLTHSAEGLGLKSLKSRVQLLNGSIDYSYDNDTAGIVLNIPF